MYVYEVGIERKLDESKKECRNRGEIMNGICRYAAEEDV